MLLAVLCLAGSNAVAPPPSSRLPPPSARLGGVLDARHPHKRRLSEIAEEELGLATPPAPPSHGVEGCCAANGGAKDSYDHSLKDSYLRPLSELTFAS